MKPSITNATPVSPKKIKEYSNFQPENYSIQNSKSTAFLTTPVSKLKATSIFTTPVPLKHNSEKDSNNVTQINLEVQGTYSIIYVVNKFLTDLSINIDQIQTEINSDNCLSPPMFANDNESHNEGKYFLLNKHKYHIYYRYVLYIYILFCSK